MFSGFLGKLLLTALVVALIWRGMRLLKVVQQRLAQVEADRASKERRAAAAAAPKPLDLAPCPLCGTYVPGGRACASREACRYRQA